VIAKYPKYERLFEGLMGNPEEDESTLLLPQWVQNSMPWLVETEKRRNSGPLAQLLSMFGAGNESGAVVMPMQSMLPVGTLNEFQSVTDPLMQGDMPSFENIQRGAADLFSSVSPGIRVPTEFALGSQAFTGQEINSSNYQDWLLGQIPAGRIGGGLLSEGTSGAGDDFMRWFTGVPVRQVTPENERSEFRRREDTLEAIRRNVVEQVNMELTAQGLPPITSLPGMDPQDLIAMLLAAAQNNNRPVQMAPEDWLVP
jgi:hypothetical protein